MTTKEHVTRVSEEEALLQFKSAASRATRDIQFRLIYRLLLWIVPFAFAEVLAFLYLNSLASLLIAVAVLGALFIGLQNLNRQIRSYRRTALLLNRSIQNLEAQHRLVVRKVGVDRTQASIKSILETLNQVTWARSPFRHVLREETLKISFDGSTEETRAFKIKVEEGKVSNVYHELAALGGTSIEGLELVFDGHAPKSKVSYRILATGKELLYIIVEFSPPLQMDDIANYTIIQETKPGLFLMTKEEILERIGKGVWPLKEPAEGSANQLVYPTDRLVTKVLLPSSYPIERSGYDVTTSGAPLERVAGEYDRLGREGAFRDHVIEESRVLELQVENPRTGLDYMILWYPPSKEADADSSDHGPSPKKA